MAAHECGNNSWKLEDVKKFSYSLKEFIYDKKRKLFGDNVDGSNANDSSGSGNFLGDGWVKLAKYDDEVKYLMTKFSKTVWINRFNQSVQFNATLLNML